MKFHGNARVVLSPLGGVEDDVLRSIQEAVHSVFGLSSTMRCLLPEVGFAFDPARQQFHSTAILDRLAACLPDSGLKILAVVPFDLFIPILTHVYGEAQLGGRACILSTCRLRKGEAGPCSPAVLAERVAKEAVHELGHTFDLRHCPDTRCIMHYCRSLGDVDRKENQFCRYCRVMLDDALRAEEGEIGN